MFALFTYVYRGPQSYIYLRKQGTHPAGRVANRIIFKLGELNRCLQAEAAAGPWGGGCGGGGVQRAAAGLGDALAPVVYDQDTYIPFQLQL